MTKRILHNKVTTEQLWAGFGNNFDNYCQVLCEFLDNSISNIRGNRSQLTQSQIQITIIENSDGSIKTRIEDTGTGIKNPSAAFSVGDCSSPDSTMNEHGFGFKHALAKADPKNRNWMIATKSEACEEGKFLSITAPYSIESQEYAELPLDEWPGSFANRTGSIFEFTCSKHLFATIERGNIGFEKRIERLVEILGFTYSGIIVKGGLALNLIATRKDGSSHLYDIGAVLPEWDETSIDATTKKPLKGCEKVDLGDGLVEIEYQFGQIFESRDNYYYYKCTQRSSGVEIRLNGRILKNNLLHDVWSDTEQHNKFNHFLAVINLKSDNRAALPSTVTTKSDLSADDEKLAELYAWIRRKMRIPEADGSGKYAKTEVETFQELKKAKERHLKNANVETEVLTFKTLGIVGEPVDMYVSTSEYVEIYEGKKKTTKPLDLFQLLMYWNGLICDDPDNPPTTGYLIAPDHSEAVKTIVNYVNSELKDALGNPYNIMLETWEDEGMDNPE